MQIVGKEPERVEEATLLPERAGQHGVDLIDDQQTQSELACKLSGTRAHADDRKTRGDHRAEGHQKLFAEVLLERLGRHLHRDDRNPRRAVDLVEHGRMVANELLDDVRFPHAWRSREQKAGHAVSRRKREQFFEVLQCLICAGVVDPAILPDPVNPLVGGFRRNGAELRL